MVMSELSLRVSTHEPSARDRRLAFFYEMGRKKLIRKKTPFKRVKEEVLTWYDKNEVMV